MPDIAVLDWLPSGHRPTERSRRVLQHVAYKRALAGPAGGEDGSRPLLHVKALEDIWFRRSGLLQSVRQ